MFMGTFGDKMTQKITPLKIVPSFLYIYDINLADFRFAVLFLKCKVEQKVAACLLTFKNLHVK